LCFGILALVYFIPSIWIKNKKEKAVKKVLKESEKFNNIENYIQLKKYEFERLENLFIFLLGTYIILFLTFKVINLTTGFLYLMFGVIFVVLLGISIALNKHQKHLMKRLYEKKDSLMKR